MRKVIQLLLSLIFALPMLFGGVSLGVFSYDNSKDSTPSVESLIGDDRENPSGEKSQLDSENEEYTEKTYADYFTDLDISKSTINDDDLSGTGSQSDPYVVKNVRGFLYLVDSTVSGVPTLSTKYIELGGNIILNDETFDINGNPTGGDGKYYQFKNTGRGVLHFDGKGYSIKGLYMNQGTTGDLCMFSSIQTIQNLTVEDFYMQGKHTCALAGSNTYLKNCNVVNGTMRAESTALGFVWNGTHIENCVSDIKMFSKSQGAGFARTSISIKKSTNYSDITCEIQPSGDIGFSGFVKAMEGAGEKRIEDCKNYGNIIAKNSNYVSAFLPVASSSSSYSIRNCENYGKIQGASHTGSFVGMARGNIVILSCENYGKAVCEIANANMIGSFVGSLYSNVNLTIKNCKGNINEYISLIGTNYVYNSSESQHLTIDGCEFSAYRRENGEGIIFDYLSCIDNLKISNSKINLIGNNEPRLLGLNLQGYYNNPSKILTLSISNILILGDVQNPTLNYNNIYRSMPTQVDLKVDGVIFNCNNLKKYYGSNFRNFFVSWKTGKIELKSMYGVASFQGEVTEDVLLQKNFTKGIL